MAVQKKHMLLRILAILFFIALAALLGLVLVLTITEYHPADEEALVPEGAASRPLVAGQEITLLTWNIGYGALGDNADFFMDGGTHVNTASRQRVERNVNDALEFVASVNPDIALLQEVDIDSSRSFHINQVEQFANLLPGRESYFANNYKTVMVPLGFPPYGQVDSGVQTLTAYAATSAVRASLPLSYSWPISTAQTKRCQLVTRIPVEGTQHELVLINEHPDAYTDEESHAAQMEVIRKTLEREAEAGNWVIAGGDWNHTFSNVDVSAYPLEDEGNWKPGYVDVNDFTEGWQFLMDSSTPTSRLLNEPLATEDGQRYELIPQYYMLDGYIASANVKVLELETQDLHMVASDHNPVVMKVLLEER